MRGFVVPGLNSSDNKAGTLIGRVRNKTQCREAEYADWVPVKAYYAKATRTARYLFTGLLAKANPVLCHFYCYRGKKQKRTKKNLRGKKVQCSVSLKHAKREREPWLLVSSLPTETYTPIHIMSLYKQRMQIEEAFRDLKNTRNGFSLRHCRSFETERLNVALLIAAIAMFLLWIIGVITKQQQQHYQYQANTIRNRSVLSTFTIGWQTLRRKQQFYVAEFFSALISIQMAAKYAYSE